MEHAIFHLMSSVPDAFNLVGGPSNRELHLGLIFLGC